MRMISSFFWVCCELKIQIPQSISLVKQSSNTFKLFSGLNGVLIVAMHEKQRVFVHVSANLIFFIQPISKP